MRRAAARIYASGTGSRGRIAAPFRAELHHRAAPPRARGGDSALRGGEVLDADAERLEQRDLGGAAPARHAAEQQLAEHADHVVVADAALALREQEVAGLVQE